MRGYHNYPIEISICHKRFLVSSGTLIAYLPGMPPSEVAHIVYMLSRADLYMAKAMAYVFDHMQEVTEHDTSAALLDRLENSYKQKARRHRFHGYHPTIETFIKLGDIFSFEAFGHHPQFFDAMCTFFTRNYESMLRRDPYEVVECLRALEGMGERITAALACVVRSPYYGDFEEALQEMYEEEGDYALTDHSMEELQTLDSQVDARRRRQRREMVRLPGRRRGPCGRGGLGRGLLNGTDLRTSKLVNLAVERPEQLLVQLGRPGGGHRRLEGRGMRHLEQFYDTDGESDDDSEFEGYPRRGRSGHRLRKEMEWMGLARRPMAMITDV